MTAGLRTLLALVVLSGAPFALGCPHPDAFDGHVFHDGRRSFRTGPIPASWERLRLDGPLLAFHDGANHGSVDVYAQCGKDALDTSLVALRTQLLIGFTERNLHDEKLVSLDRREALRTVVDAKLDGVPVTLDVFVLKKDGCVYDLVYVASPGAFPSGVQAFESFVAGFEALGG
ncbi:MAG: hypothetical protein NVSMB47_10840 [Polyangiales bacterium]